MTEKEKNGQPATEATKNDKDNKEDEISLFRLALKLGMVFTIVAMTSFVFIKIPVGETGYYERKPVKDKIIKAINNDADLETIKHIFTTKKVDKPSVMKQLFIKSDKEYYMETVTLNHILMDVKVEYYTNNSDTASNFFEKLEKVLSENNELNPFDKLETHQKYFFENIRKLVGVDYLRIGEDLNKISDELARKNSLVNEYLSDAKWSYRLSIFAFAISIISVIIGVYAVFRQKAKSKIAATEPVKKKEPMVKT